MTADWVYTAGPFQAFHHAFEIRTEKEALGRYLDELWAACRTDENPLVSYGLDRAHRIYADETVRGERVSPSVALRDLIRLINADVIASAGNLVVVHAAAAALNGNVVLFPAPAGSGKSTLVAGLMRQRWAYLSDEAVALDPRSLDVIPYPKPLSIDPGSWGVLADLQPRVPPELETYLSEQWHVAPGGAASRNTVDQPHVVVFPAYQPAAALDLQPLPRPEGLMLLADSCFNIQDRRAGVLAVLGMLSRNATFYRLVLGGLSEAVVVLERVVSTRCARR